METDTHICPSLLRETGGESGYSPKALKQLFVGKERLKRQKIAKSSICFEFQVVVAVVGFKWHRRGNAKNAD